MEGKRTVESLGWLMESAIMPKKIKAIEGVNTASIIDDLRARRKHLSNDLFSHKNADITFCNTRDKLEMKAKNDGSVSYTALEKKAELYDKLTGGLRLLSTLASPPGRTFPPPQPRIIKGAIPIRVMIDSGGGSAFAMPKCGGRQDIADDFRA